MTSDDIAIAQIITKLHEIHHLEEKISDLYLSLGTKEAKDRALGLATAGIHLSEPRSYALLAKINYAINCQP